MLNSGDIAKGCRSGCSTAAAKELQVELQDYMLPSSRQAWEAKWTQMGGELQAVPVYPAMETCRLEMYFMLSLPYSKPVHLSFPTEFLF